MSGNTNMNPAWAKLIALMAEYDAAAVGTPERKSLGQRIEKEGAKLSERDYWKVVAAYEETVKEAARQAKRGAEPGIMKA